MYLDTYERDETRSLVVGLNIDGLSACWNALTMPASEQYLF